MNHSSNLLCSWWAINNIKRYVSSGGELELFMPKALQHQLTIKTGHMQNAFPIRLDQREQGHLKSITTPHLCSINTLLLMVCVFNFNFDKVRCCNWFLHQPPQPPSVRVLYYHMWEQHFSLCVLSIRQYISDMGPLGSVLCGPFGFYYAPHRSCHCRLDHRGAPSTAERILLNKKRSAICCGKWCYTAAQMSTAEMRWCMVTALWATGSSDGFWAVQFVHSGSFDSYKEMSLRRAHLYTAAQISHSLKSCPPRGGNGCFEHNSGSPMATKLSCVTRSETHSGWSNVHDNHKPHQSCWSCFIELRSMLLLLLLLSLSLLFFLRACPHRIKCLWRFF